MNRKQKDELIRTCHRQGIRDAQVIFAMSNGWGDWTVERIETALARLDERVNRPEETPRPVARLKNPIERINNTSMDALRFKDFLGLKVGGHDQFSALRGKNLESKVSQDILTSIQDALPHDRKSQHSAIRWVLRGLEANRAIRKVKTDLEVGENANYAREEREFWESESGPDIALDAMKDGEDLDEIIHLSPETEFQVGSFTVIRSAPNLATIVSSDGEVLAEKEINNEKHWQHFLKKFRESEEYRKECTGGK
jgi:hypothetical protein